MLPEKLYRSGKPEYMKRLVEEGEIVFRPLSYYRSLEGIKGDSYEGRIQFKGAGIKFEVGDVDGTNFQELESVSEMNFGLTKRDNQSVCVSCFSRESLTKHGSATVEVSNLEGFVDRLDSYLARFNNVL